MNKQIFAVKPSFTPADAINNAGGLAYLRSDEEALAQFVLTGCFGDTFYTKASDQLTQTLELAAKCSTEFIAKLAIYARVNGRMKDTPAVLLAYLAHRDINTCAAIFQRVADNGKMVRNFVQVIRSGVVGRKSLGSRPRALVRRWLKQDPSYVFRQSIGNDPSVADLIKLTHPRPDNDEQRALFAYLIGKPYTFEHLPSIVKDFEAYKMTGGKVPKVPFEMLTGAALGEQEWEDISLQATWNQIRMNLNTFERHGVFKHPQTVKYLAGMLSSPAEVAKANVFPYQLMTAYLNVTPTVPQELKIALQQALELATKNVPSFPGKVYVAVDVSGSMSSPITGDRGVSSKMRCIDVAALFASSVLRRNPTAELLPFDTTVHKHALNPLDSIATNAQALARFGGGGTDCSLPLELMNNNHVKADLVIYVSDNESWMDNYRNRTGMSAEWQQFKRRNPQAKLVCIDLTPNRTCQAKSSGDVLNVGGFSDAVFDVIADFATDRKKNLLSAVDSVSINPG